MCFTCSDVFEFGSDEEIKNHMKIQDEITLVSQPGWSNTAVNDRVNANSKQHFIVLQY